jgi:Histidine kinase-, DNA gyrase B-, and HSP90-like ATPase
MAGTKAAFTFSPRILEHLGISAYNSVRKCLAELVANSYDADAKQVWISLPDVIDENASIALSDNGRGMTTDDLTVHERLSHPNPYYAIGPQPISVIACPFKLLNIQRQPQLRPAVASISSLRHSLRSRSLRCSSATLHASKARPASIANPAVVLLNKFSSKSNAIPADTNKKRVDGADRRWKTSRRGLLGLGLSPWCPGLLSPTSCVTKKSST